MQFTYRLAKENDFEGFYKIKCDPQNVKWSGFMKSPNRESLLKWFITNMQNPKRHIYLVLCDDIKIVGFFYVDIISDKICEAASQGILTGYTNIGLGTRTLEWSGEIGEKNGAELIQTWVSENNIASYRRLEKLNWRKTEEFECKDVPLAGGVQRFYKWEKTLK